MKHLARIGAVGGSVLMSTLLTVGMGFASADSITYTGPGSRNAIYSSNTTNSVVANQNKVNFNNQNYQIATSGSARVNGNTRASNTYGGNGNANCDKQTNHSNNGGQQQADWSYWNPASWQQNGQSFSNWWSGMMGQLGSYGAGSWSMGGNNWQPSGSGWQSSWSNWNPMLWQQHGSSYNNWYSKVMPYLTSHCGYWQQNWSNNSGNNYGNNSSNENNYGGYGSGTAASDSAATGNASNTNATQVAVRISNARPQSTQENQNNNNAHDSISMTGPQSSNTISDITRNSVEQTNANNVDFTNNNHQTASTGNASVSDNTFGGSARSGNASNMNSTDFELAITNN